MPIYEQNRISLTEKIRKLLLLLLLLLLYWGLNLGLLLARQVLCHSSHASSSFCCSNFSDMVSGFCQGPDSDHGPPTYASHLAGIIDMCHQHPGCLLTWGLMKSASQAEL
jgi:hypothetical protein